MGVAAEYFVHFRIFPFVLIFMTMQSNQYDVNDPHPIVREEEVLDIPLISGTVSEDTICTFVQMGILEFTDYLLYRYVGMKSTEAFNRVYWEPLDLMVASNATKYAKMKEKRERVE